MLAAGALVASLLAVGSSPAGAVNQVMDEPIETSACVGPALADHMFTDVVDGHAFVDAINCVAYYGITNGNGDGSTFAPNDDVTRAEMAVFISRAAEVAGVSLGSGSGGFSDIGDIWQEAQDAINGLASKGMIPKGGEFRPHAAITRAEMATFLVGLLVEGAPNVNLDPDGVILLGTGGSADDADDYFADSRAAVPRDNDDEISALYELGVTKGASDVPGGAPGSNVLVTMYTTAITFVDHDNNANTPDQRIRNPQGASIGSTIPLTFDGDGKATFSVSGLPDSAPAVESDKYEVDIRIQHTPPPGARAGAALPPLPYNYDPHGTVNRGEMAAFITRALAHTRARPEGITAQFAGGNVVVSARDANYAPVRNVVVDLFRIDTPGIDLAFRADGTCGEAAPMDSTATSGYTCEIDGTDNTTNSRGDVNVNLGDKVDRGGTTVWVWTGKNEAKVDDESELYRLDISEAEAKEPATSIKVTTEHGGEKAHLGRSVLYTAQLVDKNGDPATKYSRTLTFTGVALFTGNDLASDGDPKVGTLPAYQVNDVNTGQFAVADSASGAPTGANGAVIFSTEDGVLDNTDIKVKVAPAAKFAVVDQRGANNRVTVTVTDQYGDPISDIQVRVDSADDSDTNADDPTVVVPAGRHYAVGSDGSHSFGYESYIEDSSTETLTATIAHYDHDGDTATAALVSTAADADPTGAIGQGTVRVGRSGHRRREHCSADHGVRQGDEHAPTLAPKATCSSSDTTRTIGSTSIIPILTVLVPCRIRPSGLAPTPRSRRRCRRRQATR